MIDRSQKEFLENYAAGLPVEKDLQTFAAWLKTAPAGEVEEVFAYYESLKAEQKLSPMGMQTLIGKIEAALDQVDIGVNYPKKNEIKETRIFSLKRIAIAAAAVILIVAGYWWLINSKEKVPPGAEQVIAGGDVSAPIGNRAMITLSDGRTVFLDSVDNGQLAIQQNVKLVKSADGKVTYCAEPGTIKNSEIIYNTLTNPRGSRVIDVRLSDGTHVWLNAGSSITYPVVFGMNVRRVRMSGEAYFEVAHVTSFGLASEKRAKIPFLVESNGVTTEVLGTHFNVNAYTDEKSIKVTLLEGSVRLFRNAENILLKPGEQGIVAPASTLRVASADTDEVMAWKNGRFIFRSLDIGSIMRQIGRWYDLNIFFAGQEPKGTITAALSRDINLGTLLKALQISGVQFEIKDKTIIIKP